MTIDVVSNNVVVDNVTSSEESKAIFTPVTQKPKSLGRIRYRVEYLSPTDIVLHQYETTGIHYEEETHVSEEEKPVFEIVTTIRTGKTTIVEGEKVTTGRAPTRSMHILSVAVMHALRNVVHYYPSQDFASDIVKIAAPYAVLVHHYDELMEYRENCKHDSGKELCYRERDAYEDLGVLKKFLDEHVMPEVEEERARNARGNGTFDMLWVSFKPGMPFVGRGGDSDHRAGIVHSLTAGSFETPVMPWSLTYWTLRYDGTYIGRCLDIITLTGFDGESSLNFKTFDIHEEPLEERVQEIIEDGHRYYGLLRKQCKYYKGNTANFPHNEVDGLVMTDMDAYYAENPISRPTLMGHSADKRTWISDCTCSVCSHRRDNNMEKSSAPFESIYAIYPKNDQILKDLQAFLLPNKIWAYAFRTRSWEELKVKGFSDPIFEENMIDNLVMDKKRVQTLKALAKSFVRQNQHGEKSTREPWSADFVKGKGNGLTFLLHGKPGVGKTCTAECIAAFTSRPLMVLTSSDIGTSPAEVEANLTNHFKQARSWGAVLLIDEADVFMERRSTADLNRNSLVAGFLRALEFYDGILFLTTNRVGSFDDAFISRIHVQLYYPDFDDESRRKIWQTFIDKLRRERGDYIRLNIDAKEYLEGKELKSVQWNGREIRNAFQTAVALAEYEATKDEEGKILLTDKHLKSVVEMSRDFKEYLNELHKGDEGKRAERRYERLNM